MSSDWISPSNLPPESCSARFSASSSKARGSRPAAISFGRSAISPTPTMTGMRSSGSGEFGFDILLVSLSRYQFWLSFFPVIASEAKQSISPRKERKKEWIASSQVLLAMTGRASTYLLRHQRIHVLHRLDKIFLEFLHHGAGGFHAVDQADALADEITHEVARLCVACGRGAIDRVEGITADDALQWHWQRAGAVGSAVPGIGPYRAQLPRRLSGAALGPDGIARRGRH